MNDLALKLCVNLSERVRRGEIELDLESGVKPGANRE